MSHKLRLKDFISKKLEKLAKEKQKIYIIPTKIGFLYIGILFTIFLIGLSYGNNLTLSVAFILFTYFIIQMLSTHKNLEVIKIKSIDINDNFSDSQIDIVLTTQNPINPGQFELEIPRKNRVKLCVNNNQLKGATELNRGHYKDKHIKVANTGQAGLFYVWRYFPFEYSFYVYPHKSYLNFPNNYQKIEDISIADENEFFCHLPYTQGMSSRRLNWKVYAKTNNLYWKKFTGTMNKEVKLEYSKMPGDKEEKLSFLCFLLTLAFQKKIPWQLILPSTIINGKSTRDDYIKSLQKLSEIPSD